MKPITTTSFLVAFFVSAVLSATENPVGCAGFRMPSPSVTYRDNDWRPESIGSLSSKTRALTVHYQKGVTLEYAEQILKAAERASVVEIDEKRFKTPSIDKGLGGDNNLDLYIVTNLAAGIGGYTGFSGFNDDKMSSAYGFIVLSDKLKSNYLRGVVAHEFFHTIQMSYRWWEEAPLLEGTATWIPDHVVPDENYYWHYFPFFNATPFHSLNYFVQEAGYQYGAALWFTFLDERFGKGDGSFIRELWEGISQVPSDLEPHYFRVLEAKLGGRVNLQNAFIEFGIWRTLIGSREDRHHFKKGPNWERAVDPFFQFSSLGGIQEIKGTGIPKLEPYGHALFALQNPEATVSENQFSISGEKGGIYTLTPLIRSATGLEILPSQSFQGEESHTVNFTTAPSVKEMIFILSYFGDAKTDLDHHIATARGFSYGLSSRPGFNRDMKKRLSHLEEPLR